MSGCEGWRARVDDSLLIASIKDSWGNRNLRVWTNTHSLDPSYCAVLTEKEGNYSSYFGIHKRGANWHCHHACGCEQGQLTALETVIKDTEAELTRLQRSKVANMVKMYQGELPNPSIIIFIITRFPVLKTRYVEQCLYCSSPILAFSPPVNAFSQPLNAGTHFSTNKSWGP